MASDQPAHNSRPRFIALNGPDECGKDTVAGVIREIIEGSQMTVVTKAFADRVKIAIGAAFGVGDPQEAIDWYDHLKKGQITAISPYPRDASHQINLTGREFIELFAETHKELFGHTFWVDQVLPLDRVELSRLWKIPNPDIDHILPDFAVVTDLRYDIEYQRLQELGGEVWGIIGRGVKRNSHDIPHKYLIDNSGSIADLYGQVRTWLAYP